MSKCEQCIVRELSSLKALGKEDLLHLAECKTSKLVRKGEVIFDEGEVVNGVFCVKDGVCKLSKLSANGKDQIVKLVKKGELLGQRSMIAEEPAQLKAVALEDMQVCFIPKVDIMGFFNENRAFSLAMTRSLCGDLREADDLMVAMAQKTVKERLAHTLLYLADNFGTDQDQNLSLQLSREELSGIIGTATESAIRLLSELNKLGAIALEGKKIRIKDRRTLMRLSGD